MDRRRAVRVAELGVEVMGKKKIPPQFVLEL